MEESLHRAVRIHVIIGVGMMLDMGGGPVQSRSLEGHGTADEEEGTYPIGSFEPLVGEHSMVAHGDTQGTESVPDK
jgi:hypothetical protein